MSYPGALALWSESISIALIVVGKLEIVVGRRIFMKDIPPYMHTFSTINTPITTPHISPLLVRLSLNLAKECLG